MRGRRLLGIAAALAPWVIASTLVTFTLDAHFAAQAKRQVRILAPEPVHPRAPEPKSKDVIFAPGEKVPS